MEILPVEEVLFRACGVNNMGEGEFSVPLSMHPQDLETQRMQEIRLRNERRYDVRNVDPRELRSHMMPGISKCLNTIMLCILF